MGADLLDKIAEYSALRYLSKAAERSVPAHGFYPVKKSEASQDGSPVEKGWKKKQVVVANHYPVRPKPEVNPHTGTKKRRYLAKTAMPSPFGAAGSPVSSRSMTPRQRAGYGAAGPMIGAELGAQAVEAGTGLIAAPIHAYNYATGGGTRRSRKALRAVESPARAVRDAGSALAGRVAPGADAALRRIRSGVHMLGDAGSLAANVVSAPKKALTWMGAAGDAAERMSDTSTAPRAGRKRPYATHQGPVIRRPRTKLKSSLKYLSGSTPWSDKGKPPPAPKPVPPRRRAKAAYSTPPGISMSTSRSPMGHSAQGRYLSAGS